MDVCSDISENAVLDESVKTTKHLLWLRKVMIMSGTAMVLTLLKVKSSFLGRASFVFWTDHPEQWRALRFEILMTTGLYNLLPFLKGSYVISVELERAEILKIAFTP